MTAPIVVRNEAARFLGEPLMRLATARVDGRLVWGAIDGDLDPSGEGALSLTDVTEAYASPTALVAASTVDRATLDRLTAEAPQLPITGADLLQPIPAPARVLCVGINYADHAAETGRSTEPQPYPTIFTRFASSLVGHLDGIVCPAASEMLDFEGELAVVIGGHGRDLEPATALDVVAGYACFMDGSVRDYQRHTSQFTPGKNFDRSGAWGPWITTRDEVGDGSGLVLTTTVDGEVVQQASTSLLIHDVAAIVAYCSIFAELQPGDVIATGTPSGVGMARTPQRWLRPGETVAVDIERVGRLVNPITA